MKNKINEQEKTNKNYEKKYSLINKIISSILIDDAAKKEYEAVLKKAKVARIR